AMLKDSSYDLILLDELNIALKYDYIDLDRVLDDLQARPEMQHVVVTGRGAPQELIDLADTVTEMGVVKHAFKDQGIKAQKGVERWMATLMVQGTTSDAGKTTVVAALCRWLGRQGVSVAPFKPQNMALNSAVTVDGGEIGRSTALQALASGLEPHSDMNPV